MSDGFGSGAFVARAIDARRNITLFQVLPHVGPEVGVANRVVSFVKSKMAKGVMCKSKDLLMDATVGWDDETFTQKPEAIFNNKIWHFSGCG